MKIELPLPKIKVKGKYANLSLNIYRNAYYRTLNQAKKEYNEIALLKLRPFRKLKFNKAKITYTLFCKTKQRRDLANFCVVIDKFVSDSLVKLDIIADDDCSHLMEVNYRFGGYGEDKIIIEVEEIK